MIKKKKKCLGSSVVLSRSKQQNQGCQRDFTNAENVCGSYLHIFAALFSTFERQVFNFAQNIGLTLLAHTKTLILNRVVDFCFWFVCVCRSLATCKLKEHFLFACAVYSAHLIMDLSLTISVYLAVFCLKHIWAMQLNRCAKPERFVLANLLQTGLSKTTAYLHCVLTMKPVS